MKTLRTVFVVATVFCFMSSIAYVQGMERKGGPCRADVEKFCKGVQPEKGQLAQCMKQHEAELSPACRERMVEVKEEAQESMKACKPDVEKFCKDVLHGKGRIIHCLKINEAQLSSPCRELMNRQAY